MHQLRLEQAAALLRETERLDSAWSRPLAGAPPQPAARGDQPASVCRPYPAPGLRAQTAVIIQQIYYRYYHGFTKDERFASMGEVTKMLLNASLRAIESNGI